MSIWNDRFADKELLFHGALWVVHGVQKLLHLPTGAPFNIPSLLLIAAALLAFIFAMRRMGVSPPLIMTFAILMPLISANFMFRLIMMRPHVLSIAFLLVTCALLSKGTLRFRMIAAGVISFIYAWTYSNPQFIVIPAFVFALAYRKFFRAEYGRPQLRHFHMVVGIAVRLPAVHDQRSQNAQPDERNRKCEDQEDSRVFPAAELFLKLRIGIFFHGFFT